MAALSYLQTSPQSSAVCQRHGSIPCLFVSYCLQFLNVNLSKSKDTTFAYHCLWLHIDYHKFQPRKVLDYGLKIWMFFFCKDANIDPSNFENNKTVHFLPTISLFLFFHFLSTLLERLCITTKYIKSKIYYSMYSWLFSTNSLPLLLIKSRYSEKDAKSWSIFHL